MKISFDDIQKAAETLKGHVVRTPTVVAGPLRQVFGFKGYFKLETLQLTGSFKPRGSYIKLSTLTEKQRKAGVIAASAGNHAQGVACHAHKLGTSATIVMPFDTPFTKILRTEALGAKVILEGETLYESTDYAKKLCQEKGMTFLHPFDDEEVIKGQGTVGLEIMEDVPDVDVVIIPIGGGGLISGSAIAIKHLNPQVKIIGVESDRYNSMQKAMNDIQDNVAAGQTIAEGIAVKKPGVLNQEIVKKYVDEIVTVTEQEIEEAIYLLVNQEKVVTEGAGAATTAAMLKLRDQLKDKKVCGVISGGNIDPGLLSNILVRGLTRNQQMVRLLVEITDRPGSLAKVARIIAEVGGNVFDINHQRSDLKLHPKQAYLEILLETMGIEHTMRIVNRLKEANLNTRILD